MYINENIHKVKASGVAFDVGFIYDPRWNGVSMGLAIKNYGPEMEFSGSGFERSLDGRPAQPLSAPFDLPSSISMGVAYEFLNSGSNLASVAANFRSNNYQDDFFQGGLEYSYDDLLFVRGGYNFSEQDSYLYGATLGAGLSVEFGETRLSIDYSWTETEVFDDNQYFTFRVNF
jgi:hypothetical protein